MALTRKERLLKAMLEDNAAGCGGGVTREERMLAGVAKKTCDNDVLDGVITKNVQFVDGSYLAPGMIQYYGGDTIAEIVGWLQSLSEYNVVITRVVIKPDNTSENRRNTSSSIINNGDGTYNAIVYFGDDLAPIIFDSVNNKIKIDPDWVEPEAGGGSMWKNLAIFKKPGNSKYKCNMTYDEVLAALMDRTLIGAQIVMTDFDEIDTLGGSSFNGVSSVMPYINVRSGWVNNIQVSHDNGELYILEDGTVTYENPNGSPM